MVTPEDFERAREEVSYRQYFIDQIDLEGGQRYVRKVWYNSKPDPENPRTCMVCNIPLGAYFGQKGKRSHIEIFPISFLKEAHPRLEDFLSTLIDHEIFGHAKSFFEGFDPCASSIRMEAEAMPIHMERMSRRHCSPEYLELVNRANRILTTPIF